MASYKTVTTISEGLYKEKSSKFIAYLFPINDEVEFRLQLEKIKKQHLKARHFCYAYIVKSDKEKMNHF